MQCIYMYVIKKQLLMIYKFLYRRVWICTPHPSFDQVLHWQTYLSWENRPERVAIPQKFYIGLRPWFIIVKQVVVDWVTGMVWDPNQEGYIGKFGGKILLSAKKHYLNGKKHKKNVVCILICLNTYMCTLTCIGLIMVIPFMLIKIVMHDSVIFLPWTNGCLFSAVVPEKKNRGF